jgi:hypothetical protein
VRYVFTAVVATMLELAGIAIVAVALGYALGWPWGLFAIGVGSTLFGAVLDARNVAIGDDE